MIFYIIRGCSDKLKKDVFMQLRVTPTEKQAIAMYCKNRGVKFSEVTRSLWFDLMVQEVKYQVRNYGCETTEKITGTSNSR